MSSAVPVSGPDRERWRRRAWWLVGGTLAYNVVEALIAITFGVVDDSVVLFGFGLDSIIEVSAGAAMLGRLRLEPGGVCGERAHRAELRVLRFVGGTLLLLACYVGFEAVRTLTRGVQPHASPVGIGLAAASLLVMPAMAWGKLRAAAALDSKALRAEAMGTIACSYLSVTLFVGLVANAAAGWWWADPAAALLMVPWLAKEGVEGLRGERCC